MKKAITYSANLIKSANSVKWIFGLSFGQSGETPYLGGHSGPLKVNEACHTHSCRISLHYCINAFDLRYFYAFRSSTKIADNTAFRQNACTTRYWD
jgi:hypothetical protein